MIHLESQVSFSESFVSSFESTTSLSSSPSSCRGFHRLAEKRAWAEDLNSFNISCLTLSDLGFSNRSEKSCSSFASTEAFPLLSKLACNRICSDLAAMKPTDPCPSPQLHRDLISWFLSDRFENLVNRIVDVPVCVVSRHWSSFENHSRTTATSSSTGSEPECPSGEARCQRVAIDPRDNCVDAFYSSGSGWRRSNSAFCVIISLCDCGSGGGELLLRDSQGKVVRLSATGLSGGGGGGGGGAGMAWVLQGGMVDYCLLASDAASARDKCVGAASRADDATKQGGATLPEACVSGGGDWLTLVSFSQRRHENYNVYMTIIYRDSELGGIYGLCSLEIFRSHSVSHFRSLPLPLPLSLALYSTLLFFPNITTHPPYTLPHSSIPLLFRAPIFTLHLVFPNQPHHLSSLPVSEHPAADHQPLSGGGMG